MDVHTTSLISLPIPASTDIILAELTQNETKPIRIAAMKNTVKVILKNIVSLAILFITF
jgi:hypothetical protein